MAASCALNKVRQDLVNKNLTDEKLNAPIENYSPIVDYITKITSMAKTKYDVDMGRLFAINPIVTPTDNIYTPKGKAGLKLVANEPAFEAIDRSPKMINALREKRLREEVMARDQKAATEVQKLKEEGQYDVTEEGDVVVPTTLEKGSKGNAVMKMRETYMKQFGSLSTNTVMSDYWLNHPIMQNPTIANLFNFARKLNPDFKIEEVKDLDQHAVALIRDHIILLKEGQIVDDLPEEVSHFFIALLPEDSTLLKQIMSDIINYPIYGEVYDKYKDDPIYRTEDGAINIDKIKKEAAAQLVSQYIKHAFKGTADATYKKNRSKIRQWIDAFFKFLRKYFYSQMTQTSTEVAVDHTSPFQDVAERILRGDVGMLDLQKEVSPYDSVFYSKVMDQISEPFEASDLVKTLHTFSRGMKTTIQRTFFTFIEDKDMKGLKDLLRDPNYANFNRMWNVINLLKDAETDFAIFKDADTVNIHSLAEATMKLAEAYHAMQEIPEAVNKLIEDLKVKQKAGKLGEEDLVNNIREIQNYMTFSTAFLKITNQFTQLLSYVREQEGKYREKYPHFEGTYEKMIKEMSSVELRFREMDHTLHKILKDHLLDLTDKWTETIFENYTKDVTDRMEKSQYERTKANLKKHLYEQVTTRDQLRNILNGELPPVKSFIRKDGKKVKVDLSKIKDISQGDYLIFLLGAASTMSDPFVSNAMAYYIDKKFEHAQQSLTEQRSYAQKILPILGRLSKLGYYEAQRKIQTVQNTFDELAEDNIFKVRTLLSETNRAQFNFEKQMLIKKINDLTKEQNNLRRTLKDKRDMPEDKKKQIMDMLEALVPQIEAAKKAYDDFLTLNSYRPYTDEFYRRHKLMDSKKGDSTTLAALKALRLRINKQLNGLSQAITVGGTYEDYKDHEIELAKMFAEEALLKDKLPQREKEDYDEWNKLYELDKENTERNVAKHRNAWVSSVVRVQLSLPTNTMSYEDIKKKAEDTYDYFYSMNVPTDEFWDEYNAINDEIASITNSKNDYTITLNQELKRLTDEKNKILRVKNQRQEVALANIRYNATPGHPDKILYEYLKELETKISGLRTKIRILGSVGSGLTPEAIKGMGAAIDTFFGFHAIIMEGDSITLERITDLFSPYYNITPSVAKGIKEGMAKILNQGLTKDQNAFKNIVDLLDPKDKYGKHVVDFFLTGKSLEDVAAQEERLDDQFRSSARLDEETRERINEKYAEQDALRSYTLSMDYVFGPLVQLNNYGKLALQMAKDFRKMRREAIEKGETLDETLAPEIDEELIRSKLVWWSNVNITTVSNVEELLGDGFYETMVNFIEWLGDTNPDDTTSQDFLDFFKGIHNTRITKVNDVITAIHTPMNYLRKVSPVRKSHSTKEVPYFLRQNKVREFMTDENGNQIPLITKRIDDLDPEVLAGRAKPNVDINGKWLPLPNSKFRNEDYAKLASATDKESKDLMELLNEYKITYLTYQKERLSEGERMDLVMPSRRVDKFENTKLHIKNIDEWIKHVREQLTIKKDTDSPEVRDYNEELGIITKENREIYGGTIIAEASAKLSSRRRIPHQRVSEDILSNILFFIDDIHEYSAKNFVSPIFKSFADVFKMSYQENPNMNKNRAEVFHDLLNTKFYDEVPDNFANNPLIARFLNVLNNMAVRKLWADPIGALVNLTSGELMALLETAYTKDELIMYGRSTAQAATYTLHYINDVFTQAKLSRETLIANMFGFLPEKTELSERMSRMNIAADVRGFLLSPRTNTETEMAMHLGLSLILGHIVEHNGKTYNLEQIYDVDKVTGDLVLIPELASSEEMQKKYNPVNGTEVKKKRRLIVQKYTLIQGNYYDFNQSYISSTALGRTAELMKRWFVSGYIRRLQGEVLDPLYGEPRVAMHTAMIKMLTEFVKSFLNPFNKDATRATFGDYWRNGLSRQEKLALRRSAAEMVHIMVLGLFITMVLGYDIDDDDKNDKLRAMGYWKQVLLIIALRVNSEAGTFIPLPFWGLGFNETKRAVLDPFSGARGSLDNLTALASLMVGHLQYALGDKDEYNSLFYQRDGGYWYKEKGDSKLYAVLLNSIGYTGQTFEPEQYIKTIVQMQNRLK